MLDLSVLKDNQLYCLFLDCLLGNMANYLPLIDTKKFNLHYKACLIVLGLIVNMPAKEKMFLLISLF